VGNVPSKDSLNKDAACVVGSCKRFAGACNASVGSLEAVSSSSSSHDGVDDDNADDEESITRWCSGGGGCCCCTEEASSARHGVPGDDVEDDDATRTSLCPARSDGVATVSSSLTKSKTRAALPDAGAAAALTTLLRRFASARAGSAGNSSSSDDDTTRRGPGSSAAWPRMDSRNAVQSTPTSEYALLRTRSPGISRVAL